MRILTATPAGEKLLSDLLEPVLAPVWGALRGVPVADLEALEPLLLAVASTKEVAAAATPGPEAERSAETYRPAVLI